MSEEGARTAVVDLHGWAHGGDAVGRLPDGRACFVAGALPDEQVEVRVRRLHRRHATADLVEVRRASPHRMSPPCPHYGVCGGCQLQHADPQQQRALKLRVVTEQLQRIGRQPEPPVTQMRAPAGGWPAGYRAWARMGVTADGRLGFRRRGSHEIEPIERCLLLTGAAQQLRDAAGDGWPPGSEVTLTAGDGAAVVHVRLSDHAASNRDHAPDRDHAGPRAGMVPGDTVPAETVPTEDLAGMVPAHLPADIGVVVTWPDGRREVLREPAAVTTTVRDVTLRASAGAFAQAGPAAAEALVSAVLEAVGDVDGRRVVELYAGGGLLTGFLARAGATVTAVEADPVAVADAHHNLSGLDVRVLHDTVERALPRIDLVDVVVLDPPRTGARAPVCRAIAALRPARIVYVACDPAALARDVAVLDDCGYVLREVVGLDLFGHTAHVEAVAVLDRADDTAVLDRADDTTVLDRAGEPA